MDVSRRVAPGKKHASYIVRSPSFVRASARCDEAAETELLKRRSLTAAAYLMRSADDK